MTQLAHIVDIGNGIGATLGAMLAAGGVGEVPPTTTPDEAIDATGPLLAELGYAPYSPPEPTPDQLRHAAGLLVAAEWSGPGPDRDILTRLASVAVDHHATRDQLAELRAVARDAVLRAAVQAHRRGNLPALGGVIRAARRASVAPPRRATVRAPRRRHAAGAVAARAGPTDDDGPSEPPRRRGSQHEAPFASVAARKILVSQRTAPAHLGGMRGRTF
ncbi:MAG: hypothetical protein ABSC94_22525, partial [Polyangiaceae bacterium]